MLPARSLALPAISFALLASTAFSQPPQNRPAPHASQVSEPSGPKASVSRKDLYQGDIIVNRATGGASGVKPQSIGVAYPQYLWPQVAGVATVYYVIDPASDPNATSKIQTAIARSNADFPNLLQWVPLTTGGLTYVDINLSASDHSGECEAAEGYSGLLIAQPMTGSTDCTIGTILHEMGHIIGLWHEQSRSDRDSYITLNYNNVIKGSWSNYAIATDNQQTLGLYDYASVMQYPSYSFSRNGGPVIETIPAGMPLSNADGVPVPAAADYSAGDKEAIERLYGAPPTQVTITSNPVGLTVEVDGTPITTPQTFNWTLNSTHTLDVPDGVQTLTGDITDSTTSATFYYTYGRWNDSTAQSHTITIAGGSGSTLFPATSPQVATYSANFIQLVPYTSSVYPTSTGTVAVSPQPQSYTGVTGQFFVARQQATLTAAPVAGWNFYEFNNAPFWLPGGLGANPKTFYVPDTGNPVDTTAEFSNAPIYTVDVSPDAFSSNLYAYVDGDFWYLPKNFSPYMYYDTTWTPGSSHTLNLDSPEYPYSVNSRYGFSSWSDGGAQSHSIASLPATNSSYVATLAPQFAPATNFNDSLCGGTATLSPNSPTSDGFYPAGQVLTYTATAVPSWMLGGWTYDLTGNASPATLTANDETLVYANFNTTNEPLTLTSLSPSSIPAGSGPFTLTLYGTGFTGNSSVSVNPQNGTFAYPTYVSPQVMQFPMYASNVTFAGPLQIGVSNYYPLTPSGCSVSAAQTFLVTGTGSEQTTTTTVSSSENPSYYRDFPVFSATVTSSASIATGSVIFFDGTSQLGTSTLNTSGVASLSNTGLGALSVGTHSITAVYGGDTNHAGSTSAPFIETVLPYPIVFAFSPTSLTFPATNPGQTSPTQVLTLTDTGSVDGTIDYFGFSGANANEFELVTKTCGHTLAAGASCTLTIAFAPTVAGTASASFVATDNAAGTNQSAGLTGTGASPATFTFSPTSVTFPSTNLNATSASQVLTITNMSSSTATVSSYQFSGTNASEFYLASKTCGTSLAAGASCTLTIGFKPTVAGSASANLVATDSAAGSPQSVPLSGTATSLPTVSFSPSSLTFPSTNVGVTAPAQVLTVFNTGTQLMTVSSYKFTGTSASEFSIQSKTCGTSLAANSSCTITILFKPTAVGSASATLVATDSALGSPQSVALSGTGAAQPTISFSPTSLTFPMTNLGATSASQVLTISNTSTSPISVSSYLFSGTNASEFSLLSKTCGTSLAASASCTLTIVFKPTVSGSASANLVATDNAAGSPQPVPLSGMAGTPPTVTFSPVSLTFPATRVGSNSASQVITVSNTGTSSMSVKSYVFSGTNASEFSLVAKTCGTSLAASSSCTLTIAFKPSATGSASANLVATDSGTGSPQSVPLSGTGQ